MIIGGGPLGQVAEALRLRFHKPVLGRIPSAVERIMDLIGEVAKARRRGEAPEPPFLL